MKLEFKLLQKVVYMDGFGEIIVFKRFLRGLLLNFYVQLFYKRTFNLPNPSQPLPG